MNRENKVSEHKTIMIIDDSKVSRMMIKVIVLDKHPDITILEAGDGLEAFKLSVDKNVDFYSVDYNMPNMDGLEFITKMSAQSSDSKFALLTANIQEATHKKAELADAICINKPINEACISQMMEYFYE
jgi:two-component system, chemotaxis family, chemotaxis protein CheY